MKWTNFEILAFMLGVFAVTSCSLDGDNTECITITEPIVLEDRPVDQFHSIFIRGLGNILLTQGSPQSVQIQTHEELLTMIHTSVNKQTLIITTDFEVCLNGQINQLDIHITTPDIEELTADGVASFQGQNDFDLDQLSIDLNGVGDVILSGTCPIFDISSMGVGNISTFDLLTDTCSVRIEGSGNVEVTVAELLEVIILGAGNVNYKGDPMISSTISGTGSLIDAN